MADGFESPDLSPGALGRAYGAGTLEKLFHDAQLALDDPERGLFLERVSDAHLAGEIDLIACASWTDGPIDYMASQVYEKTIPSLDMDVCGFTALARAVAARSKDGAVPYFLCEVASAWARQDRERVVGMLAAIRGGSAPDSLLITTLQAGLLAARGEFLSLVIGMLVEGDDTQSRAAGFVLGTVTPFGDKEASDVAETIATAIGSGDAERRAVAFDAALSIGMREGADESIARSALESVARRGIPQLRQIAAKALFLARGAISIEFLGELCTFLGEVETGEIDTIEMINNAVAQRLKHSGPCRQLLEDMLRSEVADLKAMDDCAYHILQANYGSLELILADWIADGADGLIAAVRDIIQMPASQRDMTLDLDSPPTR